MLESKAVTEVRPLEKLKGCSGAGLCCTATLYVLAPCTVDSIFDFGTIIIVGGVTQWQNVGLWPAKFPCPALDLQLMGDH